MKRTIFLRVFSVFCAVAYGLLLRYSILYNLPIHKLWFSTALFFLGSILLLRSAFYRIDSSLWCAVFFAACSVTGYLGYLYRFDSWKLAAGYLFAAGYASLLVFVFFRQIFHIKTFAILSGAVLLLLLYCTDVLGNLSFSILGPSYVFVILGIIFYSVGRNTKKV